MIGTGYVGLSLAVLISKRYPVVAIDVDKKKVELINSKKSPIVDKEIEYHLSNERLNLVASSNNRDCAGADFVIIATPTNYDPITCKFDTSIVEDVIETTSKNNPNATIVIKSTIPIGYTKRLYNLGYHNIVFSPEFLREGRALYDNLHPSRIVVGIPDRNEDLIKRGNIFMNILKESSLDRDTSMIMTGSSEAEAIKLFSNSYLAMRVSFFNELDSFAEMNDLNSGEIISGVSADPRIGDYYNNPSFGYGGYCLPKDTKELLHNFENVPNKIIEAIVSSNDVRKNFIVDQIIKNMRKRGCVGIYRLGMKSGSDNFREASILDIIKLLGEKNVEIIIYEPSLLETEFANCRVVNSIKEFKKESEIIVANRIDNLISDVSEKVYTRDVLHRD